MITTRIDVKPHLKEYLLGKLNGFEDGPVQFSDKLDIYHLIWDLLEKRPENVFIDRGNLEIALPDRRIGKSPETYNYLGKRSCEILEKKIEVMMWAEVHDLLDTNKHSLGINYNVSIHHFMRKYDIQSLTEDAYLKNYYRWRDQVRGKSQKRQYRRT